MIEEAFRIGVVLALTVVVAVLATAAALAGILLVMSPFILIAWLLS